MEMDDGADDDNIVTLHGDRGERVYETTMITNSRRYTPHACPHKGPFTVDAKLGTVECGDCGALLNPMYVLELMAAKETYWNMRQRDLGRYLAEINEEIKGRERTKCTHCGNMTAIRFKAKVPFTWHPEPYQ